MDTHISNHDDIDVSEDSLGDPCGTLSTNFIKPKETVRTMTYAIVNLANWASLGILWTWGTSVFLCSKSVLNFKNRNIMCDSTYSTVGEELQKNAAVVVCKRSVHEDRLTSDCAVAAWHHMEYLTCPIGIFGHGYYDEFL